MLSVRALAAEEARLRAAVALLAAVEEIRFGARGRRSPLLPGLEAACWGALVRYAATAPLAPGAERVAMRKGA